MQLDLSTEDLHTLVQLLPIGSDLRYRLTSAWCIATLLDAGVSEDDPRIALMRVPTSELTPDMVQAANAAGNEIEPSEDATIQLPAWPTNEVPMSPPFGWRIENNVVVADRNEHLVMKYLLLGKKQGWNYQQVADDLNGRRLRNRSGRRWTSSAVSRVHRVSCGYEANREWVNRWA